MSEIKRLFGNYVSILFQKIAKAKLKRHGFLMWCDNLNLGEKQKEVSPKVY